MGYKRAKENLEGRTFGALLVTSAAPDVEMSCDVRKAWNVKCICGKELVVIARNLKRGKISCGESICQTRGIRMKYAAENVTAPAPGVLC